MNTQGPVTVITGASRGIGAATARATARAGHCVVVNYAASAKRALDVVAGIRDLGGTAIAVQADVSVEAEVVHLFAIAADEFGSITGLVNNAGIAAGYGKVEDLDIEATRRMFDINVLGSFLCAREALRRMDSGSAIVNVSSAAARIGGAGEWVDYAATKGAIDTMTLGLAKEVAARGIRVNAVRPGLVDTDFNEQASPGRVERFVAGGLIPFGRCATVDEVADVVAWLLSPASSYVSGALIDVSGAR